MANCGSLLKIALVAVVLVAVIHSGLAENQKVAVCCKRVDKSEIKEPIISIIIQQPNPPCVRAVIFETEKGFFCKYVRAPWVRRKVIEYMREKASPSPVVPSSTASLLSIITSTPRPPSSPRSLPSTSTMPADEIFSGDNE